MKGTHIAAAAMAAACLLSACGDDKAPSERSFKRAVDAYVSTQPACISLPGREFPIELEKDSRELRMGGQSSIESMDSLADAGVLSAEDAEVQRKGFLGVERSVAVRRYVPTPIGEAAHQQLESGNRVSLCYGHPEVTKIVRYTEPGDVMGMKMSEVIYLQRIKDVPAWAQAAEVQAAWPAIQEAMDETKSRKAAVILTNEGWIHERMMRD